MKPIKIQSLIIVAIILTGFAFQKKNIPLTSYSISLSVKDVKKSYDFYAKLGFKPIHGEESLQQNWIVLTNGSCNIGLFQGLFPKNTITFNPEDNRSVYKALKLQELKPMNIMNMDKASGPCTFSLVDPDGNPILFDQH